MSSNAQKKREYFLRDGTMSLSAPIRRKWYKKGVDLSYLFVMISYQFKVYLLLHKYNLNFKILKNFQCLQWILKKVALKKTVLIW